MLLPVLASNTRPILGSSAITRLMTNSVTIEELVWKAVMTRCTIPVEALENIALLSHVVFRTALTAVEVSNYISHLEKQ